jgi:indolepyruvate ferredoxin oxidoreductase beta subunit
LEALRALPKISKNTQVVMNTSRILPFNIQGSEHPYPPLEDILEEMRSKSQEVKALDAVKVATQAGHILAMNMVMLGAAAAIPGFPVDKETIIKSMQDNLPEKSIPINLEAFEEGFKFCLQNL